MIIPDLNLLIYAYNASSADHETAARWLYDALLGSEEVGLAWAVVLGFVRLLSSDRVVLSPDRPETLIGIVESWFRLPGVRAVTPGVDHLAIARRLFRESGAGYRMTTDIHLAALAMEFGATLYSNDTDFGRFPGLDWKNPL